MAKKGARLPSNPGRLKAESALESSRSETVDDRMTAVRGCEATASEHSAGSLSNELEFEVTSLAADLSETAEGIAADEVLLDAWYASYSSEASQASARRDRLDGREVVIGPDDRVQVANTRDFPWRSICAMRIVAADGSTWGGTASFVSPRLLLTAGHCVFIHEHGGWARSIEISPGQNGVGIGTKPFGSRIFAGSKLRSVEGWTRNKAREYDLGAIVIDEGSAWGDELGYFGLDDMTDADLRGLRKINISGYPGDKDGTQWWDHNRVVNVPSNGRVFYYTIDTVGGQSGSLVYYKEGDGRFAVGVHTNGAPNGNSATRITTDVVNQIKKWSKEAGA